MLFSNQHFKAQVGKNIYKHAFAANNNRNGDLLHDMCIEERLTISNTKFQKKSSKCWTWCSPTGRKAQIDYILANTKWQNYVKNTEAYSTVDISSDHRVVSTKIKLSLKISKHKLADNCSKSRIHVFCAEVHNRFEVLLTKGTESENAPVPDLPGEALSREPSEDQTKMLDILPIYTIQTPDHFY